MRFLRFTPRAGVCFAGGLASVAVSCFILFFVSFGREFEDLTLAPLVKSGN